MDSTVPNLTAPLKIEDSESLLYQPTNNCYPPTDDGAHSPSTSSYGYLSPLPVSPLGGTDFATTTSGSESYGFSPDYYDDTFLQDEVMIGEDPIFSASAVMDEDTVYCYSDDML